MPHDQKKKKKKKKNGVPDRWLDYRPVGQRIPGTRFIAFKVPLKPTLNCRVPTSDSFGLWDLLDHLESQNQELGLIIDLTFTSRYYGLSDVPRSCSYIKILTEGRQVPSDAAILSFKRAVRRFLRDNRDNERLIGVHCTHGLNRTGYLVCRYLIDVDGLDAAAAVELFNSCRGHRIERQNYLNDLQRGAKRSNGGIDEPEEEAARGLAVERPLQTATAAARVTRRPSVERPLQTAAARVTRRPSVERPLQTAVVSEETRPSGDDAAEQKSADEKRPPGHRGARRRRRGGQKASDHRPPPLQSYVWSHQPPQRNQSED